jgi:hypothetical protein
MKCLTLRDLSKAAHLISIAIVESIANFVRGTIVRAYLTSFLHILIAIPVNYYCGNGHGFICFNT